MTDWIRIADAADCPPGSALEVVAGGHVVALFNVEGKFYALDGVCSHQGGPLGQGELCGAVVTCPWHGWQFDVRDGQQQINRNIVQQRFEVRIDGTDVSVRPIES
ncbi:MAG: Rieske 2Fe-2S domain-containing protein [Planctomycetes bacterium]|nr:Rieske 2Fe-2S domain-containing protein [Planctomycetota bacterium]